MSDPIERQRRLSQRPARRWVVNALLLSAGIAAPWAHAQSDGASEGSVLAEARRGSDSAAKAPPAAPDVAAKTELAARQSLLADFMHFVIIDRPDIAAAKGQELLEKKLAPADFVRLIESTGEAAKFESTVGRALRNRELEPIAAKLSKAYSEGKLSQARDPGEIAQNIQNLLGGSRAKLIAQARLKAAGEYAVPQLLSAFLDSSRPVLQAEVQRVLIDLGRHAVMPLSTALMKLPEAQQESVANVLGLTGQRAALPFLADLASTTTSSQVREACTRASDKLGGSAGSSVADLYAQLAEAYYAEKPEVTSFPGEEHQLLWAFEPSSGLGMSAIRTPVFHEAVSMRLAERSLELAPAQATVGLWVASNFKREIQTPAGYVNPAYPVAGAVTPGQTPRREAMYFAVAAGAPIGQMVLARALDTNNAPLARKAIAAIEQTAGGSSLFADAGTAGASPLVRALSFPNRRVQYEAALALAAAQPRQPFGGGERVVPTLASAIRETGQQVAAVVASNPETYQSIRKILEGAGYSVLPSGRSLADLAAPIAEASAVDLVVVHSGSGEGVPEAIQEARITPKTAAVPVFVLTSNDAAITLGRRYDNDPTVMVRPASLAEGTLSTAIKQLAQAATGGPITPVEAEQYASRGLSALRDLAIAGGEAMKVEDAAIPLMATLAGKASGDSRLKAAEVLSRIDQERAQRALIDAALGAAGGERIALLGQASGSAKRFGNKLEERHVARVIELAQKGEGAEATAAAALMGALNLPNAQLLPLIVAK